MNVLFVHQNFPGQFKHLAPELAKRSENNVVALHVNPCGPMRNVRLVRYSVSSDSSSKVHPWASDLNVKVTRGEAAYRAAIKLKEEGFNPDVIVAHPAWGESLFLKDVWPKARLGIYCEFFYHPTGADVGFDPEFASAMSDAGPQMRMRNANYQLHFEMANRGVSPTRWQRSVFPKSFQSKIDVIHDGIDTETVAPNPLVEMRLKTKQGETHLTRQDEVITFVCRNLEPYRGYHIFMRALPAIMKARPRARVLIVGHDGVGYGAAPPLPDDNTVDRPNTTWKAIFLNEVRSQLDMSRVHFLGQLHYRDFIQLLQLSTVHVYLTYPFVLSWSLLESMSSGCAIVASDTPPVREVIAHDVTGRLVDFFDKSALANEVISLCEQPEIRLKLGAAAREHVVTNYDLKTRCLPAQLNWVNSLAGTSQQIMPEHVG